MAIPPTTPVVQKIEELEFTRTIPIPADSRQTDYPDYYRAGPTSLKVSVSLPLRRNRIDFSEAGHFHYPLQPPPKARLLNGSVNVLRGGWDTRALSG